MVFSFPGWVTRWDYQPNCDQVMVEYIDTEGNSWKRLKDLACYFQHKIDIGEGGQIPELIEVAKQNADPHEFAKGSREARATQGSFEMAGVSGESRVFDIDERENERRERKDKRDSKHALEILVSIFSRWDVTQQSAQEMEC